MRRRESGGRVLLVRNETSPEDIRGMYAAGHFNGAWWYDQPCGGCGPGHGQVLCGRLRELQINEGAGYCRIGARKSMPGIISPLTAQPGRSCGDKRR